MKIKLIVCLIYLNIVVALNDDPAANQLPNFKAAHPKPVGILTTSAGAPVPWSDLSTLNPYSLISNEFFMDSLTHLTRERIPERVVHALGAGAFGYFEVTHDITSKCKAKLFEKIGKKTPIAVRFSGSVSSKGGSDTRREFRGFAVKFYTEEGNFDIVGLNTRVFNIYDPIWFPLVVHSQQPNPVTNLDDQSSVWDFVVKRREALFQTIITYTDRGTPDGYRHMPGNSIHTYQVVNKRNESYFMRFQFTPDCGKKNLNSSEATRLAGSDPGYATRDLYNAISNKQYPSWTVEAQILSVSDATKVLPEEDYPMQPIGRLVLDRNPDNFFAEIEQLAYCPCNLVPGVLGAPDKVFEARRFAYRDAHNYRLGSNNEKIPVNCPFRTKVSTYNRDGVSPVGDNERDTPNYLPNSFNGPTVTSYDQMQLLNLRQDFTSNFDQITDFYDKSLSTTEQISLGKTIAESLCSVPEFLKNQVISLLAQVSSKLSNDVAQNIKNC